MTVAAQVSEVVWRPATQEWVARSDDGRTVGAIAANVPMPGGLQWLCGLLGIDFGGTLIEGDALKALGFNGGPGQ